MNHLPIVFGIAIATVLSLSAQPAGDAVTPRDARLAWFIQTGMPEGLENPVMVMTGKHIEPVTLSNRLASGPVKIPSDGIIRLVRDVPDPEDITKRKYLALAASSVPATIDEALIILVPTQKVEGSDLIFRSRVQGLADFKGGDCLYINLTSYNVGVEFGDAKIALKPGNVKIYDGEAFSKATSVPFRYSYFHPDKKKWQVLSASLAIMSGTRREICVFSVDSVTNRVKCHGITFPVM